MSKGLKILTHDNTTLYNLTLLAGVDNDDTESTSDQESTQDQDHQEDSTNPDQTDEDKEHYNNQDTMDPNDIAAFTQEEENINQTQAEIGETDDQSQSEIDGQDQESESEETNAEEDAEDLIQTQEFVDDKQTRTRSGRVSRPVFKYVTHHNHL